MRACSSMVEQGTHNPLAIGSSPIGRTSLDDIFGPYMYSILQQAGITAKLHLGTIYAPETGATVGQVFAKVDCGGKEITVSVGFNYDPIFINTPDKVGATIVGATTYLVNKILEETERQASE